MNPLFDLSGKTAVVTGGSRGLGKDIALGLAQAGANVVILSREKQPHFQSELRAYGVTGTSIAFQLEDDHLYPELIDQIESDVGPIDIFVNNAGVQARYPSTEFPRKEWDIVMNINANAVFFLCQEVGKRMIKRGSGKIINLASLLSFQGGLTVPAYAASKGAVMQFTKSLANEWAKNGVNVNCIAPGYMETDMNTALIEDQARSKQILERIPADRWGRPQDIQGAVVFLASPASDYVHGFTLAVDGGWLGR
ncbi:2-deoxy-D-gluconate 3-dehydrogenase [Alkalihalobacillus xiaoxiensis]|uniref:2-deoxy-D-gluconate 3-dehydrogenase n=1 Tax=Shouchella xiaoxiensis TaxID=766895 RepID=A0ABS2SYX5_9BACI|nr:SDR family oxidoreductase [Shouchella xiaoxiensis]MBM7840689.1 2-deoxy-D-gluconate 3-dehydrogenase [Shouchella xiaoxiensis]